ncbi:MAG: nucleoside deaminase [Syntrophotaleaceae bacterium]
MAMPPLPFEVSLRLPAWISEVLPPADRIYPGSRERMDLVLALASANVAKQTGGPFAAAVFDMKTGLLIAAGVNLVTYCGCSAAHAEMVALMLAQRRLQSFTLNGNRLPVCELVSSTEPCAMCLGALPWSGIRSLICGARDSDARAVGFDEGDKPADWVAGLERRGIRVLRDVGREEARRIMEDYIRRGGVVYNG